MENADRVNSSNKEINDMKNRVRTVRKRIVTRFLLKMLVLVLILVLLFGVVFGVTPMKGDDMKPKLAPGDLLLYFRLESNYLRNDVVVIRVDGVKYVGRIIGMPGESIEITPDKELLINGVKVDEEEIFYPTPMYSDAVNYAIQMQGDEYFILCDKRETARDSRYFGPVKNDEIKGKVITAIRRSDI